MLPEICVPVYLCELILIAAGCSSVHNMVSVHYHCSSVFTVCNDGEDGAWLHQLPRIQNRSEVESRGEHCYHLLNLKLDTSK